MEGGLVSVAAPLRCEGGLPRPQFEIVSGVSTGALIAPFAYLGDNQDIDDVVQLYTNPRPDWVRERGLLYFLPANESFAEVPDKN